MVVNEMMEIMKSLDEVPPGKIVGSKRILGNHPPWLWETENITTRHVYVRIPYFTSSKARRQDVFCLLSCFESHVM